MHACRSWRDGADSKSVTEIHREFESHRVYRPLRANVAWVRNADMPLADVKATCPSNRTGIGTRFRAVVLWVRLPPWALYGAIVIMVSTSALQAESRDSISRGSTLL